MNKIELVLDCLVDDEEAETQILEFFKFNNVECSRMELSVLLKEMVKDNLIAINLTWKNEHDEQPYFLTTLGKEKWNNIIDE